MHLKLHLVLFGPAVLLAATVARADLTFFLTPTNQPGVVSNEVVFTGTLSNTSPTDPIFLNDLQFSFTDSATNYLTADTNVFFANVPGILLPSETYNDVVFALALATNIPPGQYFGTVTVLGGTNIFASDNLASSNFSVLMPLPTLGVALADTNILLSWPWPSIGFHLQQNSDVNTTNWATVTNFPIVTNWQNQILLPLLGTNNFYRLQNP